MLLSILINSANFQDPKIGKFYEIERDHSKLRLTVFFLIQILCYNLATSTQGK